jgi:hypothetical protein
MRNQGGIFFDILNYLKQGIYEYFLRAEQGGGQALLECFRADAKLGPRSFGNGTGTNIV